jgi:hypothetical protein
VATVGLGDLAEVAPGLIRPSIDSDGRGVGPPRGSYAAWTIYYLNWIDRNFAQEEYRYRLLKTSPEGLPHNFSAAGVLDKCSGCA